MKKFYLYALLIAGLVMSSLAYSNSKDQIYSLEIDNNLSDAIPYFYTTGKTFYQSPTVNPIPGNSHAPYKVQFPDSVTFTMVIPDNDSCVFKVYVRRNFTEFGSIYQLVTSVSRNTSNRSHYTCKRDKSTGTLSIQRK